MMAIRGLACTSSSLFPMEAATAMAASSRTLPTGTSKSPRRASDPGESWRRFRLRGGNRKFLGVLKELAAWRELAAQQRNIPRSRIIRDESLLEIASHAPTFARQKLNVAPRPASDSAKAESARYGEAVRKQLEEQAAEDPKTAVPRYIAALQKMLE